MAMIGESATDATLVSGSADEPAITAPVPRRARIDGVPGGGDLALTVDELRAVARFAAGSAQEILPVFTDAHPDDPRPRAAVEAAWVFVGGGRRTALQRAAAVAAHRAAGAAATEPARLAARAAGDAAAAAYLHPIASATQVGHILRATACAARVAQLTAGGDPAAAARILDDACRRATPVLVDVLRRYPPAPAGGNRLAALVADLDAALRGRAPGG